MIPTPTAKPTVKKKQLKITLKRSAIGRLEAQRRTLDALKLHHPNNTRVLNDTPQVRGMIQTVVHLVEVEEI